MTFVAASIEYGDARRLDRMGLQLCGNPLGITDYDNVAFPNYEFKDKVTFRVQVRLFMTILAPLHQETPNF